jgi:hypothetical protein
MESKVFKSTTAKLLAACAVMYAVILCILFFAGSTAYGAAAPDGTALAAPTAMAEQVVGVIDAAGGKFISPEMALMILGFVLIAVYRVLQWLAGKLPTVVGRTGVGVFTKLLALLFGSEVTWRNRMFSKDTEPIVQAVQKQQLVDRLKSEYPILQTDLSQLGRGL